MNEPSIAPATEMPDTRAGWERLIRNLGIRPSRSMGQNFLVEPEVVRHIADVAGVTPHMHVVEIGPGLGILTYELLHRGCRVTGIELDDELAHYLARTIGIDHRFTLVRQDARHVDVEAIAGDAPYQVVANLPYSVATIIIRRFIESMYPPQRLTVMVQREVAERMTAPPPDMSLLGLATQFYTNPELHFVVQPAAFLPQPKVDSAVLSLLVRQELPLNLPEREWMFSLAALAFQRKRKTIANGLSQGLGRAKPAIEAALAAAGIEALRRPETLSVADWVALARAIPVQP